MDRFARNRYDAVFYKRQLEKNSVHLVSVMEPISDGPEGIMVESLLIGMAEYYSAELAIKVARGERENALKCKYNGGVVPLGYVIGKEDRLYYIDPETAPIVREIFTRYADGEPAEKIAASLNERGLRTRTGKPFVKNSFFQIFKPHQTRRIRTQFSTRKGSDTFFPYQKFFAGRIKETEDSMSPEPANPRPGEWMKHSSEWGFFAWIPVRDGWVFLSTATGSQRAPEGRFRNRRLHR